MSSLSLRQAQPPSAFDCSADGALIWFADMQHALVLWDLEAERSRLRVEAAHAAKISAVVLRKELELGFSCSVDRSVRVWSLARGELVASFTCDAPLTALAVTLDGQTLVTGDAAGSVHLMRLTAVSKI